MSISVGKLRGLHQLADDRGLMVICAIDHRGTLRRSLNPKNPGAVSYQEMVDFKLDLCRAVAPVVNAVLLDPEYGAGQAIAAGVLPGNIGLLVSVEKSGYSGEATAKLTELLPGWNVGKIKRMGASAVKLLIHFRPDLKDVASRQLELVKRVARECIEEDIAFVVETLMYPVEQVGVSSKKFAEMKTGLVIETARQVTALPIDILKSEFPADMAFERDEAKLLGYCQELDRTSRLPWILLSAGVDFATFKKQVEIACKAGASGFLAGRAIWQEGTKIQSRKERMDFFNNTAALRLKELSEIVRKCGRPWYARMGAEGGEFAAVSQDWYHKY